MNEIGEFELWSLPWHDFQKSLALGLTTAVNLHNVATSANSWLSRAMRNAPPSAASVAILPHGAQRRPFTAP